MISEKVEILITKLIVREGGYVNKPEDRGGPTNWGITQATLSRWRGRWVSAVEVAALSQDEARAIYRSDYFIKPGFEAIQDPELQEFMFDFGVNSGQGTAIIALQTALRDMGANPGPIDGAIGPKTTAALRSINNEPELFFRIKCERYELLLRLVGRDHSQAIFGVGWANRLDEFNQP